MTVPPSELEAPECLDKIREDAPLRNCDRCVSSRALLDSVSGAAERAATNVGTGAPARCTMLLNLPRSPTMHRYCALASAALFIVLIIHGAAAQETDLAAVLKKPILEPRQTLAETQAFCEKRIAKVPEDLNLGAWEKYVKETRQTVLDKVVYRGEAAKWRKYRSKMEEYEPMPGGPEYRLIPMRFEALPGLWIPAMLYEPLNLERRANAPAHLCVMGHDGGGKDVAYQQIRCINLAKRGMIVLNVEWFIFCQL